MLVYVKEELTDKISATNDEVFLLLTNTDYDYFKQESNYDIIDELSEEDKAD